MYQQIARFGQLLFSKAFLFRVGFNLSPMYRRSCGRVIEVSPDLLQVKIRLWYSYKNKNYVGSIFGGSLFSSVDPFPMVQLINVIEEDFIVWDKGAKIQFRKPAFEDLYATFSYTEEELEELRQRVKKEKEIEIVKSTPLTNKAGDKVFCVVDKTLFIAEKKHFKAKRAKKATAEK